jgi:tRNA 2-thiouridine synthesizing protein A
MDADDDLVETKLLADLDRLSGARCISCDRAICGHEALCSVALGFRNSARCLPCLATGLNRPLTELRDQLLGYVQRRDCYRRAWQIAGERERQPGTGLPACLDYGINGTMPVSVGPGPDPELSVAITANWDAGDMGCGDLVLALRIRLNSMSAGSVLRVTARDPAAPEDLPAWCRLTGHQLLREAHPEYDIRRKDG